MQLPMKHYLYLISAIMLLSLVEYKLLCSNYLADTNISMSKNFKCVLPKLHKLFIAGIRDQSKK